MAALWEAFQEDKKADMEEDDEKEEIPSDTKGLDVKESKSGNVGLPPEQTGDPFTVGTPCQDALRGNIFPGRWCRVCGSHLEPHQYSRPGRYGWRASAPRARSMGYYV